MILLYFEICSRTNHKTRIIVTVMEPQNLLINQTLSNTKTQLDTDSNKFYTD